MPDRLKDKVIIVTGSGKGIGKSIAVSLASEGAKVIVNARSKSSTKPGLMVADEVASEIKEKGGTAVANYDSVSDKAGADRLIKTAVDNFGRLDVLVNNAGIIRDKMIWNMADEEWDEVIKTHLYGHFYCTRAATALMRESIKEGKQKTGKIINGSSYAGIKGNAGQANYSAAKAGVIGFTYSCALALWRSNITCNAIIPRAMTGMTDSIPDDQLRKLAATRGIAGADTLPIDKLKKKFIGGSPDAIGPLVCWLSSEEANNVNGHLFLIMEGRVGVFRPIEEWRMAYKEGMFSNDEMWEIMPNITDGLPNPAL
jgi:NAD(P)-dependent dehydrogenase (short-subunit alcohol dehydrogenase family)